MKKKGLVRLFGLASCVALLAGCGTKVDPSLEVKSLPETYHLGDVIDLDKFVSVKGPDKTFDVYLYKASREIATLKDHKITVKGEGEIKFKVSYGDLEKTLTVSSIAEMREALINVFGGYSNDYAIVGALSQDRYIHNPEYAERLFARKSVSTYLRYGYIAPEFTTGTYEFEVDGASPMSVDSQVGKSTVINTYNNFNIDFSLSDRTFVGSGSDKTECYQFTDKQIKTFAQCCLVSTYNKFPVSIPVNDGGNYDESSSTYAEVEATINNVLFSLVEEDGVKSPVAVVYAKYGTATFVADYLQFIPASEQRIDDPIIRNVLDAKHIPVDSYYKDFFATLICDTFPASESTLIEFNFGWVDGSGNVLPTPSDIEGTIFKGVPEGSVTRVLTHDAIVDVIDNEIVSGLVQHTESEVTTVYDVKKGTSGYEKVVNPDYESVYEDQYSTLAFITLNKNWPDDMLYLSKTKDNDTPEDDSDDVYIFAANLDRHYEFMDAVCFCEEHLIDLATILYEFEDRGLKEYFTFSVEYDVAANKIDISFALNWSKGVYYKVSVSIHEDTEHAYDSLVSDLMSELFA